MNELPRLTYRIAEVAEMLGVTPPTVSAMIKRGELKAFTLSPKLILVSADSLKTYLSKKGA
jgi:excisionase family DNA binding protein